MNFVQPEHLAAGVVGTMPTVYWGEVYANFGIPGLAVAPLLLGAWLTIVNAIVVSVKRRPLQLALLAILMVHFKNVGVASFSVYVVDLKLVMLLLVYFFLTVRLRLRGDGMTYPASVPRR